MANRHHSFSIRMIWIWLTITGEHGVGLAKKPWIRQTLGEISFAAHRELKKAIDPSSILHPGKFLD